MVGILERCRQETNAESLLLQQRAETGLILDTLMSAAVGGFYMLNALHPITSRRTCPQRFERLLEQTEDQPSIESCDTADVAYVSHLKALLSHLKKSSNHSLARSPRSNTASKFSQPCERANRTYGYALHILCITARASCGAPCH